VKTRQIPKILTIIGSGSLALLFVWWVFFVNFVDRNEYGFTYDKFTGEIAPVPHTGWIVTSPWRMDVHTIDLRPSQVCMNANQRVLNCKLVQFNPSGIDTFIEWHGRDAGGSVYEILKSYAFNVNEGRDCPFLTILDDMRRKVPLESETAVVAQPGVVQ
jgi:hypothetical protein